MALGSTLHYFDINLADMDRGVFEMLSLRVAKHPTETDEYLLSRVLAYCLEYREGIAFARGLDAPDEPAVWARDPDGRLRLWVEVGLPDADKLHRASKAAERVAVYTHRDPNALRRNLAGRTVYRSEDIPIYPLERGFMGRLVARLDRRTAFDLSVTERHVYVSVGGESVETVLEEQGLR